MNLLKGVKASGLSSRRAFTIEEEISTRPTPGHITFSHPAAKLLECKDGDRVYSFALPEAFADKPVQLDGAINSFFCAGIKSSYDSLKEEYETANPLNYGAEEDREARKEIRVAYNAEMKDWILEQMKERNLPNNDSVGNILRESGNSLGFSSLAPWASLNGTEEGSNNYIPKVVKGIAVTEEASVFVDDAYEATGNELGFIGINPEFTGDDDLLIQVESADDLTTEFLTLTFKDFDTKSERGGNVTSNKEANEATEVEEGEAMDELV
jgi:hypothetical protein